MNYTKGKWKAKERPDDYDWSIYTDFGEGYAPIGLVFECLPRSETEANANIIVTAVNACQEVNPDNPMAIAESIKDMYEALKECLQLIEDLMPGVAHIALQNYQRLNEAPIAGRKALANAERRDNDQRTNR